jgi:formyltetrahydrofolate deformylase
MKNEKSTAVLLLSCPDQKGLVAKISQYIAEHGGNIIDLDEHVDADEKLFAIRVAWEMENFSIPINKLEESVSKLTEEINATWHLNFLEERKRLAVFVSKYDHCLQEILWRHKLGEYYAEISLIISNHPDLNQLADNYSIPFHVFPVNKENKSEQEELEIKLLEEQNIDAVILARYMQILSGNFVNRYKNRIINIHHSFLPAFKGGNPYKQAYDRGVKIIGATSHFVTENLDEGPIIEQDIIRITHKDSVDDLKRKGRDLERLVLARALHHYLEHRVLVMGKKTIIFE